MAEIDSIYQHLCTNSVSSTNFVMHETLSVSTSPRSSPCWGIGYKTIRKSESKGIWGGYQSRDEFVTMHLR
ncbi:unnamed protein product [Rotaria magnacalcarata]|uniref:Uncharacterized protein n=1 Tax=Rotaria magnacalcarata TaxID=392030 RepID=A0A817AH65_9BILA|nr:unnamed protein product [Rotaria magnacalcarata]CAF2245648.1 unnamed protein product [Rotaria magnacalcarata]CAF4793005.1 unnamed protein product [Rotaria magnacalcarata]CAF5110111.1 unnamed protein product [Rotaria magnacalcarata]